MKKAILGFGLLVLTILVIFVRTQENTAKQADFSVSIENQKVNKDEEFTLFVTINSSVKINEVDAYLEYDDTILEYVACNQEGVTGASGTISIYQKLEQPEKEVKYAITMRALEVATTEVTIRDIYLIDDRNTDVIEINQSSAKITVTTNVCEETDATLSELLIFPGVLAPEFSTMVTEYYVEVESDVEELILTAIPTVEDSIVTIDQPEILVHGKNTIVISVTAPSGNSKTYQIHVTRMK